MTLIIKNNNFSNIIIIINNNYNNNINSTFVAAFARLSWRRVYTTMVDT